MPSFVCICICTHQCRASGEEQLLRVPDSETCDPRVISSSPNRTTDSPSQKCLYHNIWNFKITGILKTFKAPFSKRRQIGFNRSRGLIPIVFLSGCDCWLPNHSGPLGSSALPLQLLRARYLPSGKLIANQFVVIQTVVVTTPQMLVPSCKYLLFALIVQKASS